LISESISKVALPDADYIPKVIRNKMLPYKKKAFFLQRKLIIKYNYEILLN